MAKTVSMLIRAIPAPDHLAAKARAQAEGRTLEGLVLAALRDYGAGTWTPSAQTARKG